MEKETIFRKICLILYEVGSADEDAEGNFFTTGPVKEKITEETRIVEDLDCSSFQMMEMEMEIDNELQVEVDMWGIKTVGDILKCIEEAIN